MAMAMVVKNPAAPIDLMRSRRGSKRRSAKQWAFRAGMAVIALTAGLGAAAISVAQFYANKDPVLAYALLPLDGRITARLAENYFFEKPVGTAGLPAERLASLAIEQDATALRAVTTLGFLAQLRGESEKARDLFEYAQRLSRRDLKTQLWAIEDAVSRGDAGEALRHYDIALRTSKTAPAIMFPILTEALTDPAIRSGLVPILARRPAWGPSFIAHALANHGDPQALVALFVSLHSVGKPVSSDASSSVVNQLVLTNKIEDGWRYYSSLSPKVERTRSRDPNFRGGAFSSQFDWVITNDSGISTSLQQGEKDGAFVFSVSSGAGGIMLQQLQMLPHGTYRLEGRGSLNETEQAVPYWSLTCRDGREIGRVDFRPNDFQGNFIVPADCPSQTLALIARPSDKVGGISGQVDYVLLSLKQSDRSGTPK